MLFLWGYDLGFEPWVWLENKQEGQTAGLGPCFRLPGQASLEFRFFEPTAMSLCCARLVLSEQLDAAIRYSIRLGVANPVMPHPGRWADPVARALPGCCWDTFPGATLSPVSGGYQSQTMVGCFHLTHHLGGDFDHGKIVRPGFAHV